MILNMHIRHDWQKWLTPQQKHVKALCGATTTVKYSGVPGVTQQPWKISRDGVVSQGWCRACCERMIAQMDAIPNEACSAASVTRQYNIALNIVCQVAGRQRTKTFTAKPIRGTQDSRDKSKEKKVWKEYWDRRPCYLCRKSKGKSIDHIIPTAHGGPDDYWNMAMVHKACNESKGDLTMQGVYEKFPDVVFPEYFLNNLT